jgi:hypothetical protein
MRRRKLLLVLVGLAVVIAVGALLLWPQPPSRVTRDNYDRLHVGINQAEVKATLGAPGDYRRDPCRFGLERTDLLDEPFRLGFTEEWQGDAAKIVVWFDDEGVPVMKQLFRAMQPDEEIPLFNRLRARLWHQWHCWFP